MNMVDQMRLAHWPHEVLDLARDQAASKNPGMSVLANSVETLNARLLKNLSRDLLLLEIGCGTHSLLKQGMHPPQVWEGIDVAATDRKGTPSIATRIASVQAIPWPTGTFDYVVSNQSVEHWHEYGVQIAEGLSEIRRVLKPSGIAVINFPVHLHGHRLFVQGTFTELDRIIASAGFRVEKRVAVIDSSRAPYVGWRICGFPDFLVRKHPTHERTSYVVEYELRKVGEDEAGSSPPFPRAGARRSVVARHLHYGMKYALWKAANRLLGRDRVSQLGDEAR